MLGSLLAAGIVDGAGHDGPAVAAMSITGSSGTMSGISQSFGTAAAGDVWHYLLDNGKTAEQTVLNIEAMLAALMVPTANQNATAVVAALGQVAIPVDVRYVNSVQVRGTGRPGDTWGPVP